MGKNVSTPLCATHKNSERNVASKRNTDAFARGSGFHRIFTCVLASIRAMSHPMSAPKLKRREFVQYLGASAVIAAGHRLVPNWMVARASTQHHTVTPLLDNLDFSPAPVSHSGDLTLSEGFEYEVLLKRGDVLNPEGETYGDHNDYLAILQRDDATGWLWSNHENATMKFLLPGEKSDTMKYVVTRLENMGGSCIRIEKQPGGSWRPVLPHQENFRVNGLNSRLTLTGPAAGSKYVFGADEAIGSLGNCGGGITPWGTFCTAEENYKDTWGDPEMNDAPPSSSKHIQRPSEHYGYICEIDPDTRELFKHTSLGRFAHENVAFNLTREGRLVAYTADDRVEQCLYKFVSHDKYDHGAGKANRRLLSHGILYVADAKRNRWIALDPATNRKLSREGFDAARVCVHTRTAAKLAGGVPMARPEDVEVHPVTGELYVALTSWEATGIDKTKDTYFPDIAGALGRLREKDGDAGSLEFDFEILVPGSKETGLSWPDNIAFTEDNHLMVATDYAITNKIKENSSQEHLGNNFLVVIPTSGPKENEVIRFAVSPRGSEFCAPTLSLDRQELWLNVQHPGDDSPDLENLSSNFPEGGDAIPKSAMVAIRRKKA
jgi:secreted PhoX family phosphatase